MRIRWRFFTRVEFYADGVLLGSDTTAPYVQVSSSVPAHYFVLARAVLASRTNVPSAAVSVTILGTMAIDSPVDTAAVDAPFMIAGWARGRLMCLLMMVSRWR